MRDLGIPREILDIHGGATALGHPIGTSGTRLLATLISALQTHGRRQMARVPPLMSLLRGRISRRMDDYPKLGADVEAALHGLVQTGRYSSAEDVLREGVRLVQDREARLARIDAAVSRGIDDAEAGRSEDADIVLGRLRRKYEAVTAKPAA